jgi:methionyl-tRNA formyltransferase
LVVAGYGHSPFLAAFPKGGHHAHQSLLPDYRGTFPAEWALLRAEKKTGITLLKMSPEFDTGDILAQESLPIAPDDLIDPLRKLCKACRQEAVGGISAKDP